MTKRLSRNQWVKDLIASGKKEEEVCELMRKGNVEAGIKAIASPFDKLVYRRVKKALENKEDKEN